MRLSGCFLSVAVVVVLVAASCEAHPGQVEPAGGAMQNGRKLAFLDMAIANEFEDRLKDEVAKKMANYLLSMWQQDQQRAGPHPPTAADSALMDPSFIRPGRSPSTNQQIRFHQCYFNPISCFK